MESPPVFHATSELRAAPFRCAAIVTDIEGTTGSISFVRDVLFPYAQDHLSGFIARRRADPEVAQLLRDTAFAAAEPDASDDRLIAVLGEWMAEDRKITPLKTLQGLIWVEGYARGVLHGHVYADAAAGLRRWHAAGVGLYVYSSGSVAAQKLLFAHSSAGDLTPLFSGYFDTTSGAKTEPDSYRRIGAAVGRSATEILFLSDREAELDAAKLAGWQVACLARPADAPPGITSKFPAFESFDDIAICRP
jgi:enolase-phosphatase E1